MSHDPNMVAALIRRDLHSFLRGVFPIVTPGTTFSPNWHVEAMTHALTQVLDGETRRLIITVPPRHLKSIVSSVALPAFALGRDPSRQIICVSYGDLLARNLADSCRAVMRSDFYQRVFPQTKLVKGSEIELTTTARGTRFATSVGGTLTGRGGSLIIIDDPMKAQDAHSESVREGVKRWYSHTLMSRLDDKSKDSIVVVMQRLHVDDLVGHLLDQGGWTHLNLPARADTDQRIPLGNGRVYLREPGSFCIPRASRTMYWTHSNATWAPSTLQRNTNRHRSKKVATTLNGSGSSFITNRPPTSQAIGSLYRGTRR